MTGVTEVEVGIERDAYLGAVRSSYDEVADDYAEFAAKSFRRDRTGRALLGVFAEEVVEGHGPDAPALDLGCGPGHVTAHLAALGLDIRGVDVSERMVLRARADHPGLGFEQGDMTSLDLPAEGFAGILLWYTTHHLPPGWLPDFFERCRRALRPGGLLLLGTHAGAGEHLRPTTAYGEHPVSYQSFLQPADDIAAALGGAGFRIDSLTFEPRYPTSGSTVAFGAMRGGARFLARRE
jgi:SAM-dependent methyltransferase